MCGGGKAEVERIGPGALFEGQAAGFMVGGNDDECFAVGLGELEDVADGLVEVDHFRNGARAVVGVAGPVDLRAFEQQEKAFFAAFF